MTTTPTVTQEQLDRCSRIYDESHNHEVFYLVENSRGDVDDEGNIIEYTVRYLKGKGLTCTCPAGNPPCDEHGFFKYAPRMCWHIRAAVAHAVLYRHERQEQAQIESYVRQGVDRETAMRVTYSQPTQYKEAQVKQAQERCQRKPFSILR